MKIKCWFVLQLFLGINLNAQVGIGTDSPNPSSILEMKTSNKGILIPRIELTNTTTYTLTGANTVADQFNSNSMLIYNTSKKNDVTEGYYYWSQQNSTTSGKWIKLMNGKDNVVYANNGLNINANQNVILGGALEVPTTITTTNSNTLAITGLEKSGVINENIIVSSANGVLKTINSALPRIFYMPSIVIDVSTLGTGKTIDLYAQYLEQFAKPKVASVGAPATIPNYTKDQLYYYVTYFDSSVFKINSIDANGLMNYDVIGNATPSSFINIVFVVK